MIYLGGGRGDWFSVADVLGLGVDVGEGYSDDFGGIVGDDDAFCVGLVVGFGVGVGVAVWISVGVGDGEALTVGDGSIVAPRTFGIDVGCGVEEFEGSSITRAEMSSGCVYGFISVFALMSIMLTAAARKPSTMVFSLPYVLINPIQTATVFL